MLVARHRLTGRGPAPRDILPSLAAGLCLAVALRLALGGVEGMWILACLVGAGIAHMLDMRARVRVIRPAQQERRG